MEQPAPHPPQINTEGILGWALALIATLSALIVRGKFRLKAMREKVEGEAAAKIEIEYLEANEKITQAWQEEVAALRTQINKVREEARLEAKEAHEKMMEWMARALSCESRVPILMAEIETLKARVLDLERQIGERGQRGQRTDIR